MSFSAPLSRPVTALPRPVTGSGHTVEHTPRFLPPTAPPVLPTLTVGTAVLVSVVPSLLPRAAAAQGIMTGLLVLLALAVVAVGRRVRRHRAAGPTLPRSGVRRAVLAGTVVVVAAGCAAAQLHLAARTRALEMPAPPAAYWLTAALSAAVVVGTGLGLARLVVPAARVTRRSSTRLLSAALVVGAVGTTAASAAGTGWTDVLRKDLSPDHVMLQDSPFGAVRAFAARAERPGPGAVVDLAVERLVADGGLAQRAVVVVLPTGSGWVNEDAIAAVEAELDGDVALVSAQAGDLPSWFYFLFDQEPAVRSAADLVGGVLREVRGLPADARPDVYVLGESLGALAGQAAVRALPAGADEVCGVLWAGVPGATSSGHPRERSLLNVDDPVAYLSLRTALRPPSGWPAVWLPLLSYGTTWLDTNASLRPVDGHGHQYGPEQDWSLPDC